MSTPTLKQLRYFEELARQRHFGRAAESCAISQPALSMQIREMEAALGMALFERNARQVRLTAFGVEVARRVRAILRAVDELSELARAAQDGLAGQLRLGVIPTVAPYLLPGLLPALTGAWPDLDLHVREALTPRLLAELRAGGLDVAIVALPVSEPGIAETALFTEAFVLVRPRAQAADPVPGPEGLRATRLLLLEEGHCFRDQALAFCKLTPNHPREALDGSSLSTLVQLVGAGIGVTLIPQMAVAVETRSAPVAVAMFPDPQPQRTIGIVWRSTSPLAPKLARIGAMVRALGRSPQAQVPRDSSARSAPGPTG